MSNNRSGWRKFRSRGSAPTQNKLARAVAEGLESRTLLTAVTAVSPNNGAQAVAVVSNILVTFDTAIKAASVSSSTIQLRDSSNNTVAAAITVNGAVVTIDPTANLAVTNNFYYVKVVGGAAGVMSTANIALTSDFNFAFTTGAPTFNDTTVFSGLVAPTNLRFSPDGRVFVSEKSGLIKEFDNFSDTTATIVADLTTNVHNYWDRGLLGMALDPQFTTGRPYIYVLYTYDAGIGGTAPIYGTPGVISDPGTNVPSGTGPIVSGRLSRLTIGANNTVVGQELVLINDWAQQFPSHSIGDLQFGPDGYLYASAGDGASFNTADTGQFPGINDPTNEGGALRSQDLRTPGDPTGLSGSVIRIDPNTGAAAPGNPNTTGDANAQRIIAYGLRNPFRFTFRPGTSEIWIGDVGWNNWEEIDRVISPTDSVVENFGWPAYEGTYRQNGYEAANNPLIQALYADPTTTTNPYYAYQHTKQVVAGSAEPTGGSSISGEAFYNGGTYPSAYDGALFFADYSRKQIYVFYRGTNGLPDPTTAQIFKSQANGSVFLTTGPGGDLYYVDMDLGRIGRFTFNSNNTAPVARIVADKTSGPTPLVVNFDATTSSDADAGDTLTYAWDLDGDGNYNESTAAKPQYTYTASGSKTVRLRVTDRGGLTSTATIVITANGVTNTAPVVTIASPLSSLKWKVGDVISFNGSATDAQDGTLAASKLTWQLNLIHASATDPTSRHTHVIQSYTGVSSGTFTAPDHEYPSWLELTLTATDSGGLSSSTTLRIDPITTVITVTSNVAGVVLGLNDESLVGPFSRSVITGGLDNVSAPATFASGANSYNFTGWSDSGAINHTFTAPAGSVTLTANYALATNVKLSGTVIGTTGSYQGVGNTRDKAFDGSVSTFFDAPEALNGNGAWTGLDLGTAQQINLIRYAPRATWEDRMIGGKFQGSSTADFSSGVVDLYTITTSPTAGVLASVAISNTTAFRYVRYLAPNGGWGNIAEAEFYTPTSVVPPTPAAPTAISATAVTASQINLLWADNSTNETGFKVQRKTGAGGTYATIATIATPNTTSYNDTGLSASTQYYYRVYAYVTGGSDSLASNEVSATTPASTPPTPAAPTSLTATAVSSAQINLAWNDNATNETGYKVLRKTGAAGTYATVATIATANTKTYSDTGLSAGTQYFYQVVAYVTGGSDSGLSNEANATTSAAAGTGTVVREFWSGVSGNTIDKVPVNTTPTSTSILTSLEIPATSGSNWADRIRGYIVAPTTGNYIFWIASDDASQLWLSPSTDPAGKVLLASVSSYTAARAWTSKPSQKSVAISLVAGQSYYFEVLHKQGGGGSNLAVGWSKPGESTATASEVIPGSALAPLNATPVTITAPSGLTAAAQSASSILLNWADNSSNESGFYIERATGTGAYAEIGTVGANVKTFTDTGLLAATNYSYRVRAYNASTTSGYSNSASATTSGAAVVTTYVSDLAYATTPINAWGEVERDRSNGELGSADGGPIKLKGVNYAKGLGVHAYSEVTFNLNGQYKNFLTDVGLDDEQTNGSVNFQVWLDGTLAYDSGLVTSLSAIQSINLSVIGKNQLKLIVTDGGDDTQFDHADWAGARLTN